MSKPWGTIGAWAAEAEREEAEEMAAASSAVASGAAGGGDSKSFPSLKEAVNAKKKKKASKMSLQEFYIAGSEMASAASSFQYKGLTQDELLRLPTGPMERSDEELRYGKPGGGRSSGPPMGRDSSWASNRRPFGVGGFDGDDDRRGPPPRRSSDCDQPSKADEVDNWALSKKSISSFDSGRPNRYDSLGRGGGFSKADEVDNWAANKKPIQPRSWGFGSDLRMTEPDRWTRGRMGDGNEVHERRRLVLDPPRKDQSDVVELEQLARTNKASPFGAARPREEVLAKKGLDWKKLDQEIEAKKNSRPTSSQSSRPGSSQSSRSEGPALQGMERKVKSRPKVNPFGDAKPREVLLEERGSDWRKIDLELEHRSVDRPETEAEKNLKSEIERLKKELEKESSSNDTRESLREATEDRISLTVLIKHKERDLEQLIHELDDKVRFGQRVERPRSGPGRFARFAEKPPSRSGSFDEARSVESIERPRSRGMGDAWTRRADERRSFQGVRDRGFLGNSEIDRSRPKERW